MNIRVMALRELPELQEAPKDRIYLLRIQNSDPQLRMPYDPPDHKNLRQVEYVFDDCSPGESGQYLTDEVAAALVAHFGENRHTVETLIVNCMIGRNRGPAVALALNDLFHLGLNRDKFTNAYPRFNEHVYQTLMRVSND